MISNPPKLEQCARCGKWVEDGLHAQKYCDYCYKKMSDAEDYARDIRRDSRVPTFAIGNSDEE